MSTPIKAAGIGSNEQSRRGDGDGSGKVGWVGDGLGGKLEEWEI